MHVLIDAAALRSGLIGGLLIGVSSSSLFLLNGKTAGWSSIISSVARGERGWPLSFLAGASASSALLALYYPAAFGSAVVVGSPALLLFGGALIGYGTAEGNGCTSGHGVLGLGRLSPRSLAAVSTFMACGALAATASVGAPVAAAGVVTAPSSATVVAPLALLTLLGEGWRYICRPTVAAPPSSTAASLVAHVAAAACGAAFAFGLGISGMTNPARVQGFLNPFSKGGWDPALACVMGGAVAITAIVFRFASNLQSKPLLDAEAKPLRELVQYGACPKNLVFDAKLFRGAAMFGAGWGLLGVCPGPALVAAAAGSSAAQFVLAGIASGALAHAATQS